MALVEKLPQVMTMKIISLVDGQEHLSTDTEHDNFVATIILVIDLEDTFL